MISRRILLLLLLTLYVVFLLDLALFQFPGVNPPPNFIPLHSMIGDWSRGGREFVVNFVGNIVAFIPIGLIPPLARPRQATARHAALFSLSLSAIIEVAQYASGRRVADVDDLILNTLGGLLGYFLLGWLIGRRTVGERRRDGNPRGPEAL
jgi:glycopeptide antibiotics resistance protein